MRLFDLCVAKKLSGGSGGGDSRFAELVQRTITNVSDAKITQIGHSAFYGCEALTSAEFPNATVIEGEAFYFCDSLTSVEFPNATEIGSRAFYYCSSLTSIELPNVTDIGVRAFEGCTALQTLILRKRATLQNLNAIPNSSYCLIYVESVDLDWYSTATNWESLYTVGRIKSVEELPS